jgi:hypothetical protein
VSLLHLRELLTTSDGLGQRAGRERNTASEVVQGFISQQASSVYYQIYREDNRTLFGYERSDDPTTHGKQELNYFVGSGRVGRSYLYSLDGYLYQAPVSYYKQKDRWDMSPGYESDHAQSIPATSLKRSGCSTKPFNNTLRISKSW